MAGSVEPRPRRRSRTLLVLAGLAVAAAVAGTACGSGGGVDTSKYVEPKGPPVKVLAFKAKNFKFTPDQVSAPSGILELEVTSTEATHDLAIHDFDGFLVPKVSQGQTASKKVELEAGTYHFYCTIPGHEAAGMKGTLVVG